MKKTVSANNLSNRGYKFEITYESVKTCPFCNASVNEDEISAYYIKEHSYIPSTLYVVNYCKACERVYFTVHDVNDYKNLASEPIHVYPSPNMKVEFNEEIIVLSPDFVDIFKQSHEAEEEGLDRICGIGYRKALEFLIKDYAISCYPDSEESIKTNSLGYVIKNYIDSPRIKALAEASSWIGNDETHYVRKHEDYGINELKQFITATVSFIDSEIQFQKALEFTTKDKKNS